MTVVPENFVPGLDGVVAFTTEIAEPDKDGGALRYRGVDIEDLVSQRVTFGDVWALLVDGNFGSGLPPAEPFPLPIHSGDVRVDVQAGLAMLAPIWGYAPLLDIDDATARQQLARASVMALSYVAQSARGIYQPAVPQRISPGTGQHDASNVHLWAHCRLVCPHSRAEATRQAGPPVGHLRGTGPAQPGIGRRLGAGTHHRLRPTANQLAINRCHRTATLSAT